MERLGQVLALCLLVACVSGQLTISHPNPVDVGTYTDWIFIESPINVNESSITISWQEDGTSHFTFTSTSCTISQYVRSCSFRLTSNTDGAYLVKFTINGDDNNLFGAGLAEQQYTFTKRVLTFDDFPSPSRALIGLPSEPIKIYIQTASSSDLVLTPNPDTDLANQIIFNPSQVTIKAGQLSTTITWRCDYWFSQSVNVQWDITGSESAYYNDGLSGPITFVTQKRRIEVSAFSGVIAPGNAWQGSLYVYLPDQANSTVKVTPQAADTTFSPSSVTLNGATQISDQIQFTTTSTSITSKLVHFFVDQSSDNNADFYQDYITPVLMYIPKMDIQVQVPSVFVQTNGTVLSVVLPRPVASSVTVSWYASNIQFNQSSFTFTGATTAVVVAINPTNQGPDTISFKIEGTDAAYYNSIEDLTIYVGYGTFWGPDTWYVPPLYVGVESEKLPIRASFTPMASVTLTPTAPDLIFNPTSLTFSKGKEQQWFTITPKYTSNTNTNGYTSTAVQWLISGADYSWFQAPAAFGVTISQRTVQIAWSAHLYDTTRHLHKQYKVWATANYVGTKDAFSLTPSSPYFSFSPSTFYFNSKNTRVEFTATVIGVVADTTAIDYLLGGQDGGYYTLLDPYTVTTAIRPLGIDRATMAPDTRVPGDLVYFNEGPIVTSISSHHIYDFLLKSYVLPDSSLTITPHCNHATFSPKSITFKPKDGVTEIDLGVNIYDNFNSDPNHYDLPGLFLEANFSVIPQAAGTFEVWFELSGDDAPYYNVPDHQWFMFKTVTRPSYEPTQKDYTSAASSFVPSVVVVAFTVVAAMFL